MLARCAPDHPFRLDADRDDAAVRRLSGPCIGTFVNICSFPVEVKLYRNYFFILGKNLGDPMFPSILQI